MTTDTLKARRQELLGMMPDPANLPKGCYFAPRCGKKLPECDACHPETLEVSPGHFVKCLRVQKEAESHG